MRRNFTPIKFDGNRELEDVYISFMVISMLKQPISKDSKIVLSSFPRGVALLDLIDRLDIFIDYPEPKEQHVIQQTAITLRFAKWALRYNAIDFEDIRFPLLAPLLVMAQRMDPGKPFEILLRTVIVFVLGLGSSQDSTWETRFPIFTGSCVGKNKLLLNKEQPVSFVPAVGHAGLSRKSDTFFFQSLLRNQSEIWRHKMHSSDWPAAFRFLIKPSSVIHPGPQSASPHILFSGLSSEKAIAAWALKQNSKENLITWSIIQEEITKATPLLDVKDVCLVITMLHLGIQIQKAMQSSDKILLSEGSWSYIPSSMALEKQAGQRASVLTVPSRMEVRILGPNGLEKLIGSSNTAALESLCTSRQNDPGLFISALNILPPFPTNPAR